VTRCAVGHWCDGSVDGVSLCVKRPLHFCRMM
jgi:hypothetical protein